MTQQTLYNLIMAEMHSLYEVQRNTRFHSSCYWISMFHCSAMPLRAGPWRLGSGDNRNTQAKDHSWLSTEAAVVVSAQELKSGNPEYRSNHLLDLFWAFRTDAKIHFSEKKYFGVRGTLSMYVYNWLEHSAKKLQTSLYWFTEITISHSLSADYCLLLKNVVIDGLSTCDEMEEISRLISTWKIIC